MIATSDERRRTRALSGADLALFKGLFRTDVHHVNYQVIDAPLPRWANVLHAHRRLVAGRLGHRGPRCAHSQAATARTVASSSIRLTTWRPTGRPRGPVARGSVTQGTWSTVQTRAETRQRNLRRAGDLSFAKSRPADKWLIFQQSEDTLRPSICIAITATD